MSRYWDTPRLEAPPGFGGAIPNEKISHLIRPSRSGADSSGSRTLCGLGEAFRVWRQTIAGAANPVGREDWSVCVMCCAEASARGLVPGWETKLVASELARMREGWMRDKTRRFTVGLGAEPGHLRILAANEKTRAWADRNTKVVRSVLTTLDQEISARAFGQEPKAWEPVRAGGAETPKTIAARFAHLMQSGFPRETFDIQPEGAR